MTTKRSWINISLTGAIIIVIAAAAAIRLSGIKNQFTTIDDIGVAESILIQNDLYDISYIRNKIYDANHQYYDSIQYKALRYLDNRALMEPTLPLLKIVMRAVVIPQTWTYAPAQFLLTQALLLKNIGYEWTLVLGRLPSMIASVATLITLVWIHKKLDADRGKTKALAAVALVGFSWEAIIYSRHMSNYALGNLAVLGLLAIAIWAAQREALSTKQAVVLGAATAAISYAHYQALFIIPACYAAIILLRTKKWELPPKAFTKKVALAALCWSVLVGPMVILFILPQSHRSDSQAIGVGDSYYFNRETPGLAIPAYAVKFFAENTFTMVRFIIAPAQYKHPQIDIITMFVIIFALTGLVALIRSKNKKEQVIGIMIALSIATYAALIIAGKLPLSPSRHSLIYLPYLAICFGYGIEAISKLTKKEMAAVVISAAFSIALLMLSVTNFAAAQIKRENRIRETALENLVQDYQPGYLVTTQVDPYLMKFTSSWHLTYVRQSGYRLYQYENPAASAKQKRLLVLTESPLASPVCDILADIFSAANGLCEKEKVKTLYDFVFDNQTTLDISDEAKPLYNKVAIEIVDIP